MIKKLLLVAFITSPWLSQAATLSVDKGITVHTINGSSVKPDDDGHYTFDYGSLQLSADFAGKLSNGPSSEYYSSKPYVIYLEKISSDVHVSLISNKYKDVSNAGEKSLPLFEIEVDGNSVQSEQALLPPISNFFPYADVPALVTAYNKKNGLLVSNQVVADLSDLSDNLGDVQGTNVQKLQVIYLQSSTEERKAFRRWMIDQE
ncbi:DUF2057 family protein [Vibrio sp. Y2-5]|uniref:DUF2057 family protein n=1 Tax=Vibrio sp. Y2-5 TaxID=2743977 RepID=UPI00166095A7|nr:DUF2057 family protein [Vibrio sp. Y2-5]MBD0786983.1 DUF2057 family protein [Vibrio sp. Y2-5]